MPIEQLSRPVDRTVRVVDSTTPTVQTATVKISITIVRPTIGLLRTSFRLAKLGDLQGDLDGGRWLEPLHVQVEQRHLAKGDQSPFIGLLYPGQDRRSAMLLRPPTRR
jgi:hypothetical protein